MEEISNILESFKIHLLNLNFSKNTITSYCLDIEEFLKLTGIENITQINEEKVKEWSLKIKEKNIDNKTINRKFASFKKFTKYIKYAYNIDFSFEKYLKSLKIKEKLLKLPSLAEIEKLLDYIKNYRNENKINININLNNVDFKEDSSQTYLKFKQTKEWEDFRNYLLIKITFVFGLRISEACSLKIEDFMIYDQKNDKIIQKKNFTIKGKGSKERNLPILDFIFEDILILLKLYPFNFFEIIKKNPEVGKKNLFLDKKFEKVTIYFIEDFMRKIKQEVGISYDINPHIFRHCCGTYLLENNVNIREIQTLLGHSSLSTTQKYTKISKKSLLEGLNKIEI